MYKVETKMVEVQVGFKKLVPEAVLPSYAHESDSGMDVRSVENVVIPPRSYQLISTGLAPELPDGYELQVRPRSGLQCKKGIVAGWGTVDSAYKGCIGVVLYNNNDSSFKVEVGDRIAQLVVSPVYRAKVVEVSELSVSDRGTGGFGSTGVK